MKDYKPIDGVSTEWPMKDGVYIQYSAYSLETNSISGTMDSLIYTK